MAVLLAVFIPVLMLGVVLALGLYEDLVLPGTAPSAADDPGTAEAAEAAAGQADQ
ncbi:hypothetical protein [Streptomyces sp. NPDC017890]|uniref:hypothetical protein n=1 Tax=Streptomyces sp. NPDC017890 TaxID=3365015 RepID=UPI003789FD3F